VRADADLEVWCRMSSEFVFAENIWRKS